MELKIKETITNSNVLIGMDECRMLMEQVRLDLNYYDGLLKLHDYEFIKTRLTASSLKKIMANRGIKPSVSSLHANDLFKLLFKRVEHTLALMDKKTDDYHGVIDLRDNRFLAVIKDDRNEIPIGIFDKKKEAAVAYDTVMFHLTKDKKMMNFPDSNRTLDSLSSKLSKYTVNMILWMDMMNKPQKDLIQL